MFLLSCSRASAIVLEGTLDRLYELQIIPYRGAINSLESRVFFVPVVRCFKGGVFREGIFAWFSCMLKHRSVFLKLQLPFRQQLK